MKDYEGMNYQNRKRYAISKLKSAVKLKEVGYEYLELIDSVLDNRCFKCEWDDFGRCITQHHMYPQFNFSDKEVNLQCCKNALKRLT